MRIHLGPALFSINPDVLRVMVSKAEAYSTQQGDNEPVEVLAG